MKLYVGSGGANASFATILDGHGGQQNSEQNSLSEFMIVACSSIIRDRIKQF